MCLFRAALVYFALVFGAGFALGLVRVPFLVPRFGERVAELLELPVMVVVIVVVARWRQRRTGELSSRQQLAVGGIALSLMLLAEFGLALALLGRSPVEAVCQRDPVSGTVYYAALVLFALMPWWLARSRALADE